MRFSMPSVYRLSVFLLAFLRGLGGLGLIVSVGTLMGQAFFGIAPEQVPVLLAVPGIFLVFLFLMAWARRILNPAISSLSPPASRRLFDLSPVLERIQTDAQASVWRFTLLQISRLAALRNVFGAERFLVILPLIAALLWISWKAGFFLLGGIIGGVLVFRLFHRLRERCLKGLSRKAVGAGTFLLKGRRTWEALAGEDLLAGEAHRGTEAMDAYVRSYHRYYLLERGSRLLAMLFGFFGALLTLIVQFQTISLGRETPETGWIVAGLCGSILFLINGFFADLERLARLREVSREIKAFEALEHASGPVGEAGRCGIRPGGAVGGLELRALVFDDLDGLRTPPVTADILPGSVVAVEPGDPRWATLFFRGLCDPGFRCRGEVLFKDEKEPAEAVPEIFYVPAFVPGFPEVSGRENSPHGEDSPAGRKMRLLQGALSLSSGILCLDRPEEWLDKKKYARLKASLMEPAESRIIFLYSRDSGLNALAHVALPIQSDTNLDGTGAA